MAIIDDDASLTSSIPSAIFVNSKASLLSLKADSILYPALLNSEVASTTSLPVRASSTPASYALSVNIFN